MYTLLYASLPYTPGYTTPCYCFLLYTWLATMLHSVREEEALGSGPGLIRGKRLSGASQLSGV